MCSECGMRKVVSVRAPHALCVCGWLVFGCVCLLRACVRCWLVDVVVCACALAEERLCLVRASIVMRTVFPCFGLLLHQ